MDNVTRRDFLRTTGAATLGATAGTVAIPRLARSASEPIIVGSLQDLTGSISSWGYWLDRATKAAVEQVNKSGGIAGRQVKLVTEDVEGNPTVGTRKMRRLVQKERADFLIGPLHSGVGVACAPVALELKTPLFCQAMTEEMTGTLANRYIFRTTSQVRIQAEAGTKWALDNIGKKWSFAYADYSWGWSHFKETSKRVEAGGGKVLSKVAVPLGTKDFLPYLTQIDPTTEVLYGVFIGADEIAYFTQANTMGLHARMKMYSVVCTIEAVDTRDLGPAVEGAWFQEYLPRRLKYKDTADNRNLRKLNDVDPEGKQIGGPRTVAGSHYYGNWEAVYWLKRGIETSNWKSRKDTPDLVAALEGMSVKESMEFPQGDKVMRAEDHQVFADQYMSKVENGLLEVKFKIPKEKFMFEPPVNLTKMTL
jgi:branched-chain amino acid transport system substrate-binding protein